jgi:hypothetical protein
MSKYLEVCEAVARAAEALDTAENRWRDGLDGKGNTPRTAEDYGRAQDELTEILWKCRHNLQIALGEYRAYLA